LYTTTHACLCDLLSFEPWLLGKLFWVAQLWHLVMCLDSSGLNFGLFLTRWLGSS
jgi:hypothetical protein